MTNIDPAIVEALADALIDHAYTYPDSFCECTAWIGGHADWRQHIGEVLYPAVDAARAEGYEQGKAAEHRRSRAEIDKALNDFAEGEWQDAFLAGDVDDDISAAQATEAWFRDRLNLRADTIQGGTP